MAAFSPSVDDSAAAAGCFSGFIAVYPKHFTFCSDCTKIVISFGYKSKYKCVVLAESCNRVQNTLSVSWMGSGTKTVLSSAASEYCCCSLALHSPPMLMRMKKAANLMNPNTRQSHHLWRTADRNDERTCLPKDTRFHRPFYIYTAGGAMHPLNLTWTLSAELACNEKIQINATVSLQMS